MEGAAQGAAQGAEPAPRYALDDARELGCTIVNLNEIKYATLNANQEFRLGLEDIHKSIAVAIISISSILLASIDTSKDIANTDTMMEKLTNAQIQSRGSS